MYKKIAIIGGSVAGLVTALNIKDRQVDIFEEHEEIGLPFECSGLINANLFESLLVSEKSLQNKLCGSRIIFPSGKSIKFDTKHSIGYVINRPEFEKEIALRVSKNASIHKSQPINSLSDLKDHGLIIGADGTFSTVRESAGFTTLDYIYGAQYEIETVQDWPEHVSIYINKDFTDYHIWNIPVNKDRSRIGLACANVSDGFNLLQKFVSEQFNEFKILDKMQGAVPVGYVSKLKKGNIVLVGDAAGQSRPLSGGGLNLSIKCAEILGKAISTNNFGLYSREWERIKDQKIKKEIPLLSKWKKLTNAQINEVSENLFSVNFNSSTLFTAVFKEIIHLVR